MLESGGLSSERFAASLGSGHKVEPSRHAQPDVAMRRGLGGTSHWWGGRCVSRTSTTLISPRAIARRRARGQSTTPKLQVGTRRRRPFLGVGPPTFEDPVKPWTRLEGASFDKLERWARKVDMGVVHCERLSRLTCITILLGATVTGLHFDHKGGRVVRLTTRSLERTKEIAPKQVVLACGELETTRLLLAAFRSRTDLFGGQDGALGRYYMGHMSGKIADIVLSDPERAGDLDFFMHEGAYVRRKFSLAAEVQAREQLRNISFWADNRPFHAVDHRSGVLSAAWLTLFVKPVGRLLASEGVRQKPRRAAALSLACACWQCRSQPHSPPVMNSRRSCMLATFRARRDPDFFCAARVGVIRYTTILSRVPNRNSRPSMF